MYRRHEGKGWYTLTAVGQRWQTSLAFLGHVDQVWVQVSHAVLFPRAVVDDAFAVPATMPFYQLVCIAAHYPKYVCLRPAVTLDSR